MSDLNSSRALQRVSPTTLHALETCRLQVAIGRQPTGLPAPWNIRAVLGDACHHVLEKLVTCGRLTESGWQAALALEWSEELGTVASEAARHGISDPPDRWPGVELTRARLAIVARRVRALVEDAGPDAEVLPERTLLSHDGLVEGRIDLIVRSDRRHAVVDYKTGATVDPASGRMRPVYETQLQLYAYLEAERSGAWPSEAFLLPFNGPPLHLDVDPSACASRVEAARALLALYNAAAPGRQPATPTPPGCSLCPYSVVCDDFWDTATRAWASDVLAAEGPVLNVHVSQLGTVNIRLLAERGSMAAGECLIRGVRPDQHPAASGIGEGDRIRASRLRLEEERESYALPPWGRLVNLDATMPGA